MRAGPKLFVKTFDWLSFDFRARGQHLITIDSCYNEAHDDLTFNVIGAPMT